MKILVTVGVFFLGFSANSKEVDLDSLKKMALENHFGLKGERAQLESEKYKAKKSKSNFFPRFGIEAENEWLKTKKDKENDTTAHVYGQINLFNGLKDIKDLEKSEVNIEVFKNEIYQSEFELSNFIERKFYEYLFARKKLEIISDHINRVSSHGEIVINQYRSKLITETDFLEFRLHQKKLQSQNNYLKLEEEQLLSEILELTGYHSDKEVKLIGELPHLHLDSKLDEIYTFFQDSPEIRSKKQKILALNFDEKIIHGDYLPKVDLRVEHGWLNEVKTGISPSHRSSRITLNATWEFFSGFETKNSEEAISYQKSSADYALKQTLQNYKVLIEKSYKNLKMLEQIIDFEEENEKIAKTLYQNTLIEYKKGVKDSGALGSASEILSEAQSRIYELKTNYIQSKLDLEKVLGKELHFQVIKHPRNK